MESVVIHQTVDHERHECKVCGTVVPEGYFTIRRVFDEHIRAGFTHAYNVDSSAVRTHGDMKDAVEVDADLNSVIEAFRERGAL